MLHNDFYHNAQRFPREKELFLVLQFSWCFKTFFYLKFLFQGRGKMPQPSILGNISKTTRRTFLELSVAIHDLFERKR